jgi:hypothetical protein
VPKSIKPGQVLMHNSVMHTAGTACGWRGFRAWTDSKPLEHFIECPYGWAGLQHYAVDEYVEEMRKLLAKHGGQKEFDRYVKRYRQRQMLRWNAYGSATAPDRRCGHELRDES